MISKELLSEVLECDVFRIDGFEFNKLWYTTAGTVNGEYQDEINVYELANKCKEWAERQEFILLSGKIGADWFCEYSKTEYYRINGMCNLGINDSKSNSEPEAIFKACQWILDNNG